MQYKLMKKLCLVSLFFISSQLQAETLTTALLKLQKDWAIANYQTKQDKLESVFESLSKSADELLLKFPGKAEPLIWKAIVLSSDAGKNGGFAALGKVKQARELLLQAEKIDPNALNGSIYTSLGSLYYQVPGWPIGFGDEQQAEIYLNKALQINPNGIDSNYFYADYLLEQGDNKQAVVYFKRALNAPLRTDRPVADQGRQGEIDEKLKLTGTQL